MNGRTPLKRNLGLIDATGVGVGAIVGGGILALSGVAFAVTGPSAILAFLLNGIIAVIIAFSYAEMSSTFPESGGSYIFSKKVLTIESAFAIGWISWFASIVAAVLYAIGFSSFTLIAVDHIWQKSFGIPPAWLKSEFALDTLAIMATVFYTAVISRSSKGSGQWPNIGKLLFFSILIAGGLLMLAQKPSHSIKDSLSPFFTGGAIGLITAMGYTFIAFQGFDLISSVGGEIKEPQKTMPKAMIFSLVLTLLIYLPLLFVISTVGVPEGLNVAQLGRDAKEAVIAAGARNFLGVYGYWFVIAAAILSMLSALSANIFAASRVSFMMAQDRTLPRKLSILNPRYNTPVKSTLFTSIIIAVIIIAVGNVDSAGAAASLIFLITFAITQFLSILIRRRIDNAKIPFKMPLYPVLPIVGIVFCLSLAIFQGFAVPLAGLIALIWLLLGAMFFFILLGKSAKIVDASAEAYDPNLTMLRGQKPLVLVPIANPTNASSLVALASSLAPADFGKVLLLSVLTPPYGDEENGSQALKNSQEVLKRSLEASFQEGLYPESHVTVSDDVWKEIERVSKEYNCNSLVLGLTNIDADLSGSDLEKLVNSVHCDVVVLRAHSDWKFSGSSKVLVPVSGSEAHSELLARLIGTLCRVADAEIEFLRVMPEYIGWAKCEEARQELFTLAEDYVFTSNFKVKVVQNNDVVREIIDSAEDASLVILGFTKVGRYLSAFGQVTQQIVQRTDVPIVLISHSP